MQPHSETSSAYYLFGLFFAFGIFFPAQLVGDPSEQNPSSGYDGGFYIESEDGDKKLKIGTRLQAQYDAEMSDVEASKSVDRSRFLIRRARLKLSGHVLDKKISYKFQADFGAGKPASLEDFYLDYRFIPSALVLRVGQYRVPYARQQLTSSGKLQFVDRARATNLFGEPRDIGLGLHSGNDDGLEWSVGAFNGMSASPQFTGQVNSQPGNVSGQYTNTPTTFDPLFAGRIGYASDGMNGYSEADLTHGPTRYAVGLGAKTHLDNDIQTTPTMGATLDFALKSRGFATTGAVFATDTWEDSAARGVDRLGGYVQSGYSFGTWIEPVARAEYTNFVDGGNIQQYSAGLSIYLNKHALKWQTEIAGEHRDTSRQPEHWNALATTQLQLEF